MSRPLWLARMELDQHYRAMTAEFCKESGDPLPEQKRTIGRHTAVDARRLRGVPVVGVEGAGGAIPGSSPHHYE